MEKKIVCRLFVTEIKMESFTRNCFIGAIVRCDGSSLYFIFNESDILKFINSPIRRHSIQCSLIASALYVYAESKLLPVDFPFCSVLSTSS